MARYPELEQSDPEHPDTSIPHENGYALFIESDLNAPSKK
jgi:hypothetical protein